MRGKIKEAFRLAGIAYLPIFLLASLAHKCGGRKYEASKPVSWEKLIHDLPVIALVAFVICVIGGLGTVFWGKPARNTILCCPHCGARQKEKAEERHSQTRRCVVCGEESSRVSWEADGGTRFE